MTTWCVQIQTDQWFFSAFFMCREPDEFVSLYFLERAFLSLLFFALSSFSNSSMLAQNWADSHPEGISSPSCVLGIVKELFVMLWCQTRPLAFCRFQISQEHAHQDTTSISLVIIITDTIHVAILDWNSSLRRDFKELFSFYETSYCIRLEAIFIWIL